MPIPERNRSCADTKTNSAILANLTEGRTLGYFYDFALPLVTASGRGSTHGHYPELRFR